MASLSAATSPAKWYKVDRRTVCLNDFDVETICRLIYDFHHDKYPTFSLFLLAIKENGLFGGELPSCGEFCVRLALSTRRLMIRSIFMSNPASSTRGMHTSDV